MATDLRKVLEAIAWSKTGVTDEKDAMALLDIHLGHVQTADPGHGLEALIEVRDGAMNAVKNVQALLDRPQVKSRAAQLTKALDPLRRVIGKMQNDDAKPKFLLEKQKLAADIQKFDGLVARGAFRGAAAAPLADFTSTYAKGRAAMDDGEKASDWVSALELGVADVRLATGRVLREAREAYEARYKPAKAAADAVFASINAGGDFSTLPARLVDDVNGARLGLKTPEQLSADSEFAAAYAALPVADAASKAFRSAAADLVLATAKNGDKRSRDRARRQADAMLKSDPNVLRHMVELDGGREALDALVKDVGDKASSDDDKDFVAAAVKARYNVDEFTGVLSTKAVPRMYKVLSMVPESHTVNNPKLTAIERQRGSADSTYGNGKLTLNVGKTGRVHNNTRNFDPDDEVPKEWKVPGKDVSDFDVVTLHELGHSVDDKLGFMNSKGQGGGFGGWKMHNAVDVADVAGGEFGFYDDFPQLPQGMLRQALTKTLDGGFPDKAFWGTEKNLADARPSRKDLLTNELLLQAEAERERLGGDWTPAAAESRRATLTMNTSAPKHVQHQEALKRVINAILEKNQPLTRAVDGVLDALEAVGDPPADLVWQQMADHAAVKWCLKVRRKDVWKLGRAGAMENADSQRIAAYVRGTGTTYYSYLLSARGKGVSAYQFNAPAEWFAELYSAYYMGKLPESHPDHGWLKAEIHDAA